MYNSISPLSLCLFVCIVCDIHIFVAVATALGNDVTAIANVSCRDILERSLNGVEGKTNQIFNKSYEANTQQCTYKAFS